MIKLKKLAKKILHNFICICCIVGLLSQAVIMVDASTNNESPNIASNGDGYAESVTATGGDVSFLNDGNYKTNWVAKTPNAYAGIKFKQKYSINKVRVVFRDYGEDTINEFNFKFSYYDSNTNRFIDLYTDKNYNKNNNEATVGHKYYSEYVLKEEIITNEIRVTITDNSSQDMAAIGEIEAFGYEYDQSSNPTNLAFGKKVVASNTEYQRGPERIVDGNKTNYWDGGKYGTDGQYFIIDLGEICRIEEMKATPFIEKGRYYLYNIEVSTDNNNWQKVADRNEIYGTIEGFEDEIYSFNDLEARYVKVNVTYNNINESVHMCEFEVWGFVVNDSENIALHKTVSATNSDNGTVPDVITDGITNGDYWDGGSASKENPQSFTIDLGSGYFIDKMKAYPYVDGIRYYEYNIEVSLDGAKWQLVAQRTAEDGLAYAGETFVFNEALNARFIRVNMTYNSKVVVEPNNTSVHMYEFEAYGKQDPDYQLPTIDPSDSENIAFLKPVKSHLNTNSINNITDGFNVTYCTGAFAPAYFDIDLLENYKLSEIMINVPVKAQRYYYFTIYGSTDGSNYDRLYQQRSQEPATEDGYEIDLTELTNKTYRIVRVYLEYVSDTSASLLSEVRIHGEKTGENKEVLRNGSIDEILDIQPYYETKYASEITEAETIENVYGIIDRNLGEKYRDWFTFKIAKNPKQEYSEFDYYTVSYNEDNDKVIICGNDGVSLATGLNYYLKNYCKVNISEQANQTKMPDKPVKMTKSVYQYTPYKIRYGFNYCTLNYTFSYADAQMFQKEYDWLALNGVNVVLDLAGQEAVWIKFLMNFGYDFDSAKDWLAGPTYYAWQFMDNMEVIGGPVSDEWVKGRLEMARENQRWKNSLGMQTVLQGYAGMIPNNFSKYQDVEILEQGTWCQVPRPDMIRTDGELYDQYARLFYEAQEWAFGETSNYYAVDPFHEGGKRPSDLTDDVIAAEVLDSLLEYDEDAVWMVQAWWSNPTNELLKGMGEYRKDHVIILDLNGLNDAYDSYWNKTEYNGTVLESDEFNSTSWVWCMLENYGGNPSMDGRPQEIIKRINEAYNNADHLKGIGFISEATYDNPMLYELLLDMAWTEDTIDLDNWLDEYVLRRYGEFSQSARDAWDILLKTVYSRSGNTVNVIANSNPSLVEQTLPYNAIELEKALKLLYEDYDLLSSSEAYRYDLTEIMRQLVNNYAVVELGKLKRAYDAQNVEEFKLLKTNFLNAFDVLNEVCKTQQDLLIGEWVGRAVDWARNTNSDDFAYDSMIINAKTLITVWAPSTNLGTYAYRNYEGMIEDIYKVIWEAFLNRCEEKLVYGSEETQLINYNDLCMEWIYENWDLQGYQREADNSTENMDMIVKRVLKECSAYVEVPENVGNIALDKDVTANLERPDSPGAPGGGYANNVNDGSIDTYWDGIAWNGDTIPYVIIDLGKDYRIDKINIVNYYDNVRYYDYDLYVSNDGEIWEKIVNRKECYGETPSLIDGDTYEFNENKLVGRYIKLVGLYNSANEGFHVKEIRAYGSEITVTDKTALKIALDKANEITNKDLANVVPVVVAEFKAARDEANAVYNNENATQEEVNNAFDRLANAMQKLEFFKGDKTALEAFVNKVNTLEKDKYTKATWEAFEAALNNADKVLVDENALEKEINEAYDALVRAFLDLRLIPNKDLLNDLINKAESLEAANYSADTFKAMQEALANAKVVVANENATQVDVDNAKDILAKAIAGLKANTLATDNKVTSVNNGDTTSVKTGDDNLVGTLAGLTLLSVAGISLLRKKED